MEKLLVQGGNRLKGSIKVSGAKNVAMKTLVASLLTDDKVTIDNVPLISSVVGTANIVKPINVKVKFLPDNKMVINAHGINNYKIPLEMGGLYRTAPMMIVPLLYRFGKAIVPNPGGCRLGKRPIDRHIEGLKAFGAKVKYEDGYFKAEAKQLLGTNYRFSKNTHTGTETLIMAGVIAKGKTRLENAAEEPEVDDLINLLNSMGAKIKRKSGRIIEIEGVKTVNGVYHQVMADRNEIVTFAIGAYVTKGDIFVEDINPRDIMTFLETLKEAGAKYSIENKGIRFYSDGKYKPTNIIVLPHPGFMTDWQASWALFATQARGISTIHETVFESRFGYVSELRKMGARIEFYDPKVNSPKDYYNFNWSDRNPEYHQGIKIYGPSILHNAVVEVCDLRAGATLVLSALAAKGESVIYGIEHIDRGYEKFEHRLSSLGAIIKREKE